MSDVFTFLVGGKAGQGVRSAGTAAASLFMRMGRHAFQMDDYPSLIRGGHNFSVVSSSLEPVYSHYLEAQLVVALDQRSYDTHAPHLAGSGLMIRDSDVDGEGIAIPIMEEAQRYGNPQLISGVASIAALCAALGMPLSEMDEVIRKQYARRVEDNLAYARSMFQALPDRVHGRFDLEQGTPRPQSLLTGNQAIALGAIAAGLNCYFAYPMTPSTSILHFMARYGPEAHLAVMQPENEIAVANMAVGAAFAGARVMVASSGGGTALIEEAFSLAGMTEAPLLFVVSSRPGPSTGVPTYTEQGDLYFALHQGHGEFPRLVASPGSVAEAFRLTGELLALAWRFQTPAVLLTEKHLSESRVTTSLDGEVAWPQEKAHRRGPYRRYRITDDGISPLLFPPSREVIKWNSYEHDERGITTEEAETISLMHKKRQRKEESLSKYLRGMHTMNTFGRTGPVVFTYGSTTLSVREALRHAGLEAQVVQPIYLRPLPTWELEAYADQQPVVVEQSAAGSFARLLQERADISPGHVIRRYDGRPFDPRDLAHRLQEVL
ncbi:MAG: 2-oxoacid:acceptor oxidoreductase family protein [Candidatus Thermoplasmatota archaeon]|nr:2-oxoacid:acceptor oxidoreductase family protein [Candidatus Thermoplasmatota archaeon]MDD5778408.1 2-oxoacid:acceptor oxidoreductase family protein [Candidatus Thermoplasmatota archaeon]